VKESGLKVRATSTMNLLHLSNLLKIVYNICMEDKLFGSLENHDKIIFGTKQVLLLDHVETGE